MKLYAGVLVTALLLVGCEDRQPPAPPQVSATDAPPDIPVMGREVPILAFGDSLLTGYGLDNGKGYPEKLEAALRSRGINARIANAGVSGDTTADGLQRLAFALDGQQAKPELVIISLGGNDMLRGIPPEETRANLDRMLAELKGRGIPALLLGMLAAPNLGKDYENKFNPIYPSLAKKYDAALVPFFLQPLMDRPDLVQDDHIHPTDKGIEALVASTVDQVAVVVGEEDN
ncbi:MAG: arylesterase [Novosphingobium sp.]